jgi:D-arabinose 1-dehydrogenase
MSIQRSLTRLNTSYLDVVYCHDVEFVTAAEVLTAVKELRRIRDTEGTIKYIGLSGYPVSVLSNLAELVLKETGESLDCVMSYANFTLQNRRLKSEGLSRLRAAGVGVVPNASILGMGLLRSGGVPEGALGDWHPAPEGLRTACRAASAYCDSIDEKLEVVAIRWALETWLIEGESVGSKGDPASGLKWKRETIDEVGGRKLGVSVMGVSNLQELDETMKVWRSILDGLEGDRETAVQAGRWEGDHEWSFKRRDEIRVIVDGIWEKLGQWQDFAWASPGEDYVRAQPAAEMDKVPSGTSAGRKK